MQAPQGREARPRLPTGNRDSALEKLALVFLALAVEASQRLHRLRNGELCRPPVEAHAHKGGGNIGLSRIARAFRGRGQLALEREDDFLGCFFSDSRQGRRGRLRRHGPALLKTGPCRRLRAL